MGLLEGKVALVSGAGAGIGKASALHFAREGARVAVVDIDRAAAEATQKEIVGEGGDAFAIEADTSREADVARMVAETVEHFGRLDCAFNNAGIINDVRPVHETPLEDWQRVIDVNLTGVFLALRHEVPQMLSQGGGVICNMASAAGLIGWALASPYTAAKHGVVGLTKTAALEYAQQGIRVNALCPAFTWTPMVERLLGGDAAATAAAVAAHPVGRLAQPQEIAEAAAWLCSDRSSFVTGAAMPVDGGYTAQ
jgi:NAD(P)-dependent dehydrogenase (short-subunit alcohol dehydrogenase family)